MRRFYGNYLNAPRIEPYGLERIEILRGPSAMLYGQSGVGGTVNMVSKRPQDEFGGEIGVTYGSHDSKDVRFDVTGPATADGMWTYRLVGLGRDADTQVDFVPNDRLFLAPSLTFRPSVDTSFTLLGHVGRDRSGGRNATGANSSVPSSTRRRSVFTARNISIPGMITVRPESARRKSTSTRSMDG